MRILVVGGGGREHALLWKLAQSSKVAALFCAPGNAGTSGLAENLPVRVNDIDGLVSAAMEQWIDLVIVGPEEPLALGLADRLRETGIPVCGNSQAATQVESSKAFAKEVMAAAGIPTARSVVVRDVLDGIAALSQFDIPVVIKADGLAAGKGVVVAQSHDEARIVLNAFLEDHALGTAGATVVIEECLSGQEVSVLALTDGTAIVPLTPSCDYKRVFDRDQGPNTGGMGAYAPTNALDAETLDTVQRTILEPAVREMAKRGTPLQGVLYAGLMMTAAGPKVLEFNARLGDPETQVVLPLLDGDLAELCAAVANGTLAHVPAPGVAAQATVGVVLASGGYPGPIQSGLPIDGLEAVPNDVLVFHAGTRRAEGGRVVTAGGRVLTVVGLAADVATARERAYAGAKEISFPDAHFRSDIGAQEL
jgi:phosphoribosylamine--glycine ligase